MIFSSPFAAARAVLHVDVEDPLEQPCPADAARSRLSGLNFAIGGDSSFGGRLILLERPLRHHPRAKLGVGCQHAVVPDQVQPRPRQA